MRWNMTKWINVQEAMGILEEHYIQVSYKTFTDWGRVLKMRIYNGNVIFTHK